MKPKLTPVTPQYFAQLAEARRSIQQLTDSVVAEARAKGLSVQVIGDEVVIGGASPEDWTDLTRLLAGNPPPVPVVSGHWQVRP